jgi:hypothetical protein
VKLRMPEWSDLDDRHGENCIFLQLSVSVHANMIEPNNGKDRLTGQPVFSPPPSLTHATFKPKRHNGKFCPLAIRERIVNALANGDSKRAIARALRVSNNTVTAVAEQEWQQVAARKTRIAAQCEAVATKAFDQLNDRLDADTLPANVLVPIAGVATDKLLALRAGDPNSNFISIHYEMNLRANQQKADVNARLDGLRAEFGGGPMPPDADPHARFNDLARLMQAEATRRKALADASPAEENAAQKD